MAERGDKVEAAVHTVVLDVLAVEAALVPEVLLKLLVDVVRHRLPARAGDTQRHTSTEAMQADRHPASCCFSSIIELWLKHCRNDTSHVTAEMV